LGERSAPGSHDATVRWDTLRWVSRHRRAWIARLSLSLCWSRQIASEATKSSEDTTEKLSQDDRPVVVP
jgi:hypothetical protein